MKKRLLAGKVLAVILAVAVMTGVAFAVSRSMLPETTGLSAAPQPKPTVRENLTETGTRPLAAVAKWEPAARPENFSAAMLPSLSTDSALALAAQGFRSIVLPDPFKAFTAEESAKAAQVLDALEAEKVFRTLTITPVDEFSLNAFGQALGQLIADSSFDALLLADNAGADADGKGTVIFTDYLTQLLNKAELSLPIFFDLGKQTKQATDYQKAVAALAQTLPYSEVLVRCGAAGAQTLRAWAESVAGDTPVNAMFDLKSAIPNGTLPETLDFLTAMQAVVDFPKVLQGADFIPKNKEAAGLLNKFCTGALDLINASKGLSLRSPVKNLKAEQSFYTDKPTVNFAGASNPLFGLTCNGKAVPRNESGDFSMDMDLKTGKNEFKFEHQDNTYIVNVFYSVTVLESVTPKGGIETAGSIEMVVGATARRGATVTAALGGLGAITLKPGSAEEEDGASNNADSDFVSYVGMFKLPASGAEKKVMGTLVFTASYQGLSEKMNGALVTLLPANVVPPAVTEPSTDAPSSDPTDTPADCTDPNETEESTDTPGDTEEPETSQSKPGTLLTPYNNHWLGTAQMAEITVNWANARWNGTSDEKSNPTASPLLAGSFDYVTGRQTIDGNTYYQLGSGKRIKSTDLKIIDKGYKLPSNKLRASSSTGGSLTMRFGLDWKIPFNVNLTGQSYTASNGYSYGISSYSATGLEITFYHTSDYSGSVSVSSFPLVSSAQWSKDSGKNTVTLKLAFKNAGKFYGWQAYYEGSDLVIKLRPKPPSGLNGAVIWIDAGHGGSDNGSFYAASHATLKSEKAVTILIANKIKEKLQNAGATVHMTRTGDSYISPLERVRLTRQRNPDMFISIHTDAVSSASPSGTSAFYYRAFGQPLAKAIHKRIVDLYKSSIYIANNSIPNYIEMRDKVDRGTLFYPFEVTRIEECPAVLIEYGFGSNLTECRVLQSSTYQNLFAQATVNGIADYLKAQ